MSVPVGLPVFFGTLAVGWVANGGLCLESIGYGRIESWQGRRRVRLKRKQQHAYRVVLHVVDALCQRTRVKLCHGGHYVHVDELLPPGQEEGLDLSLSEPL